MAYLSNESENVFNLSESELLWDKINWSKLNLLITDDKTKIIQFDHSSNNYGEFTFIALKRGKHVLALFGHGYHESRDKWYVDTWVINELDSNLWYYDKKPVLNKAEIFQELSREHAELMPYKKTVQSSQGKLFEFIADLTDDDSAHVGFEDGEFPS